MNYVDKYGLYNVKPVGPDGEPTGNDGLIITAYAEKAGLPVDRFKIRMELATRLRARNGFPIERLPGKERPFPSRDFYLGATRLGLQTVRHFLDHRWSFSPLPIPRFNLVKLIAQGFACVGEDRNFFWEHEMDQIYRFAFSVPIQDRDYHFQVRSSGWFYSAVAWVDYHLIPAANNSSKLIRWLKYGQTPDLKVFIEYFGEDHPITAKMALRLVNNVSDL